MHRRIESPGSGQHRVAHRLEVEPAALETPPELVVRVGIATRGPIETRLLVDARQQQQPMQLLERAALGPERAGEVIEQFGMDRRRAAAAEVAWCRYERL